MTKIRSQTGASIIVLVLVIAFFISLPIGLLCWEMLRYSVAQQQLRSACDAAALSGAAAIATTATAGLTYTQVQNQAMDAAAITFKQNSIYNTQLNVCTVNKNGTAPSPPGPGQAVLNLILRDQNGVQVSTGDPAAKIMSVSAEFGYQPPMIGYYNIGPFVMNADSQGGLPQLDLILCFDVSGSMDDQTQVTFVKRWWNPKTGYVQYDIVPGGKTGTGYGGIYDLQVPPPTGTRLNAVGPENLSWADYTGSTGNTYPFMFRPDLRAHLTGSTEVGAPPGNYDSANPSNASGNGVSPSVNKTDYTDLVVNLDGKAPFAGWSDPGSKLAFPNIGVLVEAARGNLDSGANFTSAQCGKAGGDPAVFNKISPNANYSATYRAQALQCLQPMFAAQQASNNFFDTMNVSANCHFGFIAFSDGIGKPTPFWGTQSGTTTQIIDPGYTAGGTGNFPLPLVSLDPSPTQTGYANVEAAVNSLVATGKTDIADSLNEALSQLTLSNGLTRPKATRAIVLFTDGEPNLPGSGGSSTSPAANACYAAATAASSANIRIYCIGLSQNTAIKPTEDAILTKIASTTNGQYIPVSNASQLNQAFQQIARSLVVLK